MAKVKSATQKITEFLKAKGLDASEVKDAFAELEAADVDLDTLAGQVTEHKTKNDQWVQWYQQVVPEVQNTMAERDKLKARLDSLEKAGVQFTDVTPPAPAVGASQAGQYIGPEDLKKFEQRMGSASSAVMKQMVGLSFRHYKKFGKEPDWDAIEKLMGDGKVSTVEDGYRSWSKPMREERRAKKLERTIEEKTKERLKDEMSKLGAVRTRRRTEDVENAPLDKPAPSDRELRDAFVADLNAETKTN